MKHFTKFFFAFKFISESRAISDSENFFLSNAYEMLISFLYFFIASSCFYFFINYRACSLNY